MTKPTTEELKELLGKVTQGEWVDGSNVIVDLPCVYVAELDETTIYAPQANVSGMAYADATLIALSPYLAAEVVQLREALEWAVSSQPSDDSCCAWVHEARQSLSQK